MLLLTVRLGNALAIQVQKSSHRKDEERKAIKQVREIMFTEEQPSQNSSA